MDETPIVTNLLQQVTKNQIIYFRSHHETQKFTSKFNHFILWVTMILRDNLLQWSPFENQFWTFERQPYKISSVRNLILSLLWCWCYQNQALNNVILGDGSQIWPTALSKVGLVIFRLKKLVVNHPLNHLNQKNSILTSPTLLNAVATNNRFSINRFYNRFSKNNQF